MNDGTDSSEFSVQSPPVERSLALVLNRDLLFGSRIRSAISSLGLRAKFVSNAAQLAAELASNSDDVAIVVIDMNDPIDWERIREELGKAIPPPTLAFGPHVDVDARRAAKAAGIDRIVTNGQFDRGMVPLIDRYRRR
jgi:hypothetical protein